MSDKQKDQEETEQTPKGLTVPVPERGKFFENLKKATQPEKPAEKSSNAA